MTAAAQFRVIALGAAFVLGLGGAAEARAHAGHEARQGGHAEFSAHGASHIHGTPIAFSPNRHGSQERFSAHEYSRYAAHEFGGRAASGYGGRHGRSRGHGYAASFGGYGAGYASVGHSGGTIQCVTFARADSGIELSGNASAWWDHAAGVYQRGNRPEAGSVLNFRANGSMRLGHVAVVDQVVDSRTIQIDHANWGGPGAIRGGISRDIYVVDVSPTNDWSAVRVALGHSGEFGSIYPTYGFIYNRPDRGQMVASYDHSAPMPMLNPAPRDLRGRYSDTAYDEVAEAPDGPMPTLGRRVVARRHRLRVLPTRYRHHGRY